MLEDISEQQQDEPVIRGGISDRMLTDVVRTESLQHLQALFSELGGISMCICSIEGRLITRPTWGTQFTRLIGQSLTGVRRLRENIQRLTHDLGASVPALCHPEAHLYAKAIEHDGKTLSFLLIGTPPQEILPPARLSKLADEYGVNLLQLARAANDLHAWSEADRQRARQCACTLADTVSVIYGLAARVGGQLADLQTVHELAEQLASSSNLLEILNRTLERVVHVLDAKAAGIRLLDESTGELKLRAVYGLSQDYIRKGTVVLGDSEIDREAFDGSIVYVEDVPTDPRVTYPENARREGIVSALYVPMVYRGETVGLLRVYTGEVHEFSEQEKQLVLSIGSQTAAAVSNSRLQDQRAKALRIDEQLRQAREVQRRMLPAELPTHPCVEFGVVYRSSMHLAGDFYDLLQLPDGNIGVCVADVVGKGLPAALMMASLRSALRSHVNTVLHVGELMVCLNEHLCRDTLPSEFASLVFGAISPEGDGMVYCNAGHVPPLRLRGDGFDELMPNGLVLGVMTNVSYSVGEIDLNPGDIVVLTTDGVIEALSFQDEEFGMDRLRESIRRYRDCSAAELAKQILWDVRRFAGLADQSDDITVVVLKIQD